MTNRKAIWLLLAVLTFVSFYFLLPDNLDLAYKYPFAFSLVGAALLTVFSAQAIADFRSFSEYNGKSPKTWGQKSVSFLVLPGMAMIFVFAVNFEQRKTASLKQYGLRTIGTVVNRFSVVSRRGRLCKLTVAFKTNDGQQITTTESVNEQDYKHIKNGQRIDLIYSEKNPEVVAFLEGNLSRKEFDFSGEEKDVMVSDLFYLMKMEHDSLGRKLNAMNYLWIYDASDSTWKNDVRGLSIKSNHKDKIAFTSFDLKGGTRTAEIISDKYDKQFLELDFYTDDNTKTYENEHYSGTINATMKPIEGLGYQVGQVISLTKK